MQHPPCRFSTTACSLWTAPVTFRAVVLLLLRQQQAGWWHATSASSAVYKLTSRVTYRCTSVPATSWFSPRQRGMHRGCYAALMAGLALWPALPNFMSGGSVKTLVAHGARSCNACWCQTEARTELRICEGGAARPPLCFAACSKVFSRPLAGYGQLMAAASLDKPVGPQDI